MHQKWLNTQLLRDWEHFVSHHRYVARMVREAKNDWYQQAQFVEKGWWIHVCSVAKFA